MSDGRGWVAVAVVAAAVVGELRAKRAGSGARVAPPSRALRTARRRESVGWGSGDVRIDYSTQPVAHNLTLPNSLWYSSDEVWADEAPSTWQAMWDMVAEGEALKRAGPALVVYSGARVGGGFLRAQFSGVAGQVRVMLYVNAIGDESDRVYEDIFDVSATPRGFDEMMVRIERFCDDARIEADDLP